MLISFRYDEEIARLHRELEARGGSSVPRAGGPPQHVGPTQAPPPSIGHGPSNLFGGIMAGQGQAGPGLPPQPTQEQGPPQHQMPQPPPGLQQGPPPPAQGSFQPSGQYGPPVQNGYPSQGPPPPASPGTIAKRGGPGRGPGAPATPNLGPQHHDQRPGPSYNSHIANVGNALAELDLERLPEHQKKVEADWFAIFNLSLIHI